MQSHCVAREDFDAGVLMNVLLLPRMASLLNLMFTWMLICGGIDANEAIRHRGQK